MNAIKDGVVVWEVPADMKSILIELFDADKNFLKGMSITDYVTVKPGQLIRITSKTE